MSVMAELYKSIDQVDPGEWDQLVAGQPFADWHWFQITEALSVDYQPRYLLLKENGQLKMGAVCYIQNRFHSRRLQSLIGWFPRRFPTLRCDAPIHLDTGLFFSDPGRFNELFPELLRSMQTLLLKREHISFYSFDHLLPTSPTWAFLQAKNYHRIKHVGAEINLKIHWSSFEDYLKDLSKPEYEEYLRTKTELEAQSILIEAADSSSENLDASQRLQTDFNRHVHGPKLYHPDLYPRTSKLMGKDFKLVVARHDGQVIGCIAMLRNQDHWLVKWLGLDLTFLPAEMEIYYGLLAECVRQAILAGGCQIRLGASVPPTIQNFGGRLERRIGAMSIRNRPLHWLAGRVLGFTANPEPEIELPAKNG